MSTAAPKLTAEVVKNLTGLPINHVINIDFLGFAQAVYAIGCVYTDVDRRYYHSNEGVPPSEQYAEINIQPGYQQICGKQALDYVRYRHTDTDIVRSARQQDFLGFARQQISPNELAENVLFNDAQPGRRLHRVHEVRHQRRQRTARRAETAYRGAWRDDERGPLPSRTRPQLRYASQSAINEAVNEFLGVEADVRGRREAPRAPKKANSKQKGKKSKKKGKGKKKPRRRRSKPIVQAPVGRFRRPRPGREAGEMEAKIAARRVHGQFPIYYPTRLPSGAYYVESNPYEKVSDPRVYWIREGLDKNAPRHEAYRMVLVMEPSGRHPLLWRPGDPRLGRPADPRRPEPKPRRSTGASTNSSPTAARSS